MVPDRSGLLLIAAAALLLAGCATPPAPVDRPTPEEAHPAAVQGPSIQGIDLVLARLEAGIANDEARIDRRMGPGHWLRTKYSGDGCGVEIGPIGGSVIASNGAMDIHLISVGSKHGVKVGDRMTVSRKGEFVEFVVVDMVFVDKSSVTDLRTDGKLMRESDIRVGDRVESGL